MTQLESARAGIITPEMARCAADEGVAPEMIRDGVAAGTIAVLTSPVPGTKPVAVGTGLRTKVSASIGLYYPEDTPEGELEKMAAALSAGADTMMDLSVTGDIQGLRRAVLTEAGVPVGTLPMYESVHDAEQRCGSQFELTAEDIIDTIRAHAAEGVSFIALHPALTLEIVETARREGRVDPLVSWGGSHLIGWMVSKNEENPLYTHFDEILDICRAHDVTLAFADAMRPGCLADSLDNAQVSELAGIGRLVRRARAHGVQCVVKGPGHVPMDDIAATVTLEKRLCGGAPYFVFGCLPTDRAAGRDHITSAIGGAVAAYSGADFLCYVTPAEHVGMPDAADVYEGVMASRIAAHAADVALGLPAAVEQDLNMSRARQAMDWAGQFRHALDPERARAVWRSHSTSFTSECTMCGKYCAMRIVERYLRGAHAQKDNPGINSTARSGVFGQIEGANR